MLAWGGKDGSLIEFDCAARCFAVAATRMSSQSGIGMTPAQEKTECRMNCFILHSEFITDH
jgi:hypothetical protein